MNQIVAPEACTIIKLHGSNGNYKLINNDVLTVLLAESNTQLKIKSQCKGIINFTCKEGDVVCQHEVLCVLNPCPHDVVVFGICGLCSTSIEITNMGNGDIKCNTGSRMAMVHTNKFLVVNEKTALEIALTETLNLIKKRKLSLLIDLDLTILHTTSSAVPEHLQDVYHYTLKDDQNRHATVDYHTKMRPYLKQFLERMHTKFELHIYTFGNRSYAEKIREFIDPNKILFGQRIITRDDSFDIQKKTANLKSLFPRGDNMVCIIDDRPEVWNYVPNFLHVKPYIYFPDAGDINNPTEKTKDPTLRGIMNYPTKDIKVTASENKDAVIITDESDKKENEENNTPAEPLSLEYTDHDDYLLTLENILTEVHTRFYNQYDTSREKYSTNEMIEMKILPDVKTIMKEMRLEVLKGCRISFSGLIPLSQKVKETHAYQILKNLGAHYYQNVSLPSLKTTEVDECSIPPKYTTHLISHSDGTKKMKQVCHYIKEINKLINENPNKLTASIHRVNVVNIYWLWHCHFLWTKVDENQFLFLPTLQQLAPPEGVAELCYDDDTSQHSSNSGCNKRAHSEDECESSAKKIRSESDEEFLRGLVDVNEDSVSGVSTNSHASENESSFDEEEWQDSNVMLHYTEEQRSEMLKEVEDAINEERLEIHKSPASSDYYKSDDSSSTSSIDDGSDRESVIKNPPKNWEKYAVRGRQEEEEEGERGEYDNESEEEHELDYGDFEDNCEKFAVHKRGDTDSEGSFADDI